MKATISLLFFVSLAHHACAKGVEDKDLDQQHEEVKFLDLEEESFENGFALFEGTGLNITEINSTDEDGMEMDSLTDVRLERPELDGINITQLNLTTENDMDSDSDARACPAVVYTCGKSYIYQYLTSYCRTRTIKTLYYPYNYPNYYSCHWNFYSPYGTRILAKCPVISIAYDDSMVVCVSSSKCYGIRGTASRTIYMRFPRNFAKIGLRSYGNPTAKGFFCYVYY